MGEKKTEGEKKRGDEGGKENQTTAVIVVLKVDMHCEGCASKIVKCVRGFEGVETVKSDAAANRLTVTGTVNPSNIIEKLQEKTKKKVDLISPQPKKEKQSNNSSSSNNKDSNEFKQESGNNKRKDKKDDDKKSNNEKKPKEPPATTAVLKLSLHCRGCIEKIHKTVMKTKGVQEVLLDKQKELVTVKGTMDVKALTVSLTERLKRPVEIVPLKKEKEEKSKEKDNGGNGGGKKKEGDGDGGDGGAEGRGNKNMECNAGQPGSGYGDVYAYPHVPNGYYYPLQVHAPQIFSEENPNACTVM